MQGTTTVILAIVGFAIGFPVIWISIVYLISRIGGWSELATHFEYDGPAPGEVFHWCSARLRFLCNYSNCLTITLSETGIHLKTLIFFRVGHHPLFIPWAAVEDLKVYRYWRFSSAKLLIRDRSGDHTALITLYGWGLADRLEQLFKSSQAT